MSVVVQDLTKIYGEQRAVDAISFEARPGEILGFLGPNGAGKTTTMKILTGFIDATAGKAVVGGYDVAEDPMAVRKRVGYLPEHNPLYLDMYVLEYLRFVARLNGLSRARSRISELIETTGLQREQHKKIGALSKGYRQRVGLAQAMLHDPQVLILDEPTSGLDPNQLEDIRQLIKSLGKEKTVIFSTHIMQEVQNLCDRVIIIDRGQLVANDAIDELQNRIQGEIRITVGFAGSTTADALGGIPGVKSVRSLNGHRWQLITDAAQDDVRPAIFHFAVEQDLPLLELHQDTVSIEDVFQRLTTRRTSPTN
mgnify:CR=1 FL=1